jgi:hypothetical protein
VPFPDPLAPDDTPIHPALLDAVHPHPAAAVTPTDVVAPPDGALKLVGDSENVQPAAWVTVKV